ncbi:hypothetical protein DL770_000643 [Monosporascus sp. CRB-9-2]|nr:hypothetical protein DL770_000643 [Monosporascus sp. CRB-9-2]
MSGYEALLVNSVVGQQADLAFTHRGSAWYFTVCAIMGFSTLAIMLYAFAKPQNQRVFHYITAGATAVSFIAHFSMGSNLGQVPIQAEFVRPGRSQVYAAGTRQIFYARYIDWVITTPLLLLGLLLTAGVPTHTILATLLADEIMIATGLIGALARTSYKWAYWTFGMVALFFIAYELLWDARRHANRLGGKPKTAFYSCGGLLIFIWFLYPIAWALSEGGNVIHPDSEAIFYGILDILAKPVFAALLLWQHRNILPTDLGLDLRQRSERGAESHEHEKHADAGAGGARNDGQRPEEPGPSANPDPAVLGGHSGRQAPI